MVIIFIVESQKSKDKSLFIFENSYKFTTNIWNFQKKVVYLWTFSQSKLKSRKSKAEK